MAKLTVPTACVSVPPYFPSWHSQEEPAYITVRTWKGKLNVFLKQDLFATRCRFPRFKGVCLLFHIPGPTPQFDPSSPKTPFY